VITDRDIVVKVLARGKDPGSTTAGESAPGKPVTIGADHGIDQLDRNAQHEVKRLPVIDGAHPGGRGQRGRSGRARRAGAGREGRRGVCAD